MFPRMACVIRGIYDTEKKEGDFLPYVPVPKDLTKVKTKVAFNLTKRQLIFFSIAGAVGLPVYFLTRTSIDVYKRQGLYRASERNRWLFGTRLQTNRIFSRQLRI